VLVYGAGGYLIIRGELALGTVVAFVALLRKLYGPASDLAGVHVDVVTSYAYFDRIFSVLDLDPAIKDAPDAVTLASVAGAVTFRGVSFAHGLDDAVLHDVDLAVAPGECVALVGPSGSGKSTLVALIPRLADPSGGAVLVDGHDVRTLRLSSLRSHIGIVTQESFLFHGSILDNLRYGRAGATVDEVKAAARAAQIHDFIASLPDGYDTIAGDRGYRFSGGERQRIAIARVLLKNPRILILDEATSALDSASEGAVQAALEKLMEGRTTFVIAHRLSTVHRANRIAVIEKGRLVQIGTHAQLMTKDGLYARLHRQQHGAAGGASVSG
jgi:ATP-binding cassette subfamily B protein